MFSVDRLLYSSLQHLVKYLVIIKVEKMQWLQQIADEIITRNPTGEILVASGGSPSGTYHLGHMRELVICDALLLELRRRGRQARHIYYIDDLDAMRKVPVNVPPEWERYLGMPLCDVP